MTAFTDELIRKLSKAGEYSRAEVTAYLAEVLRERRDAIGRYWLDRITPLEDFALQGGRLEFRDLAVERGYAPQSPRAYRYWVEGSGSRTEFRGQGFELPEMRLSNDIKPDRFGRTPLTGIWIQSRRRDGGWALPAEVILGRTAGASGLAVLGWRHAAR